MAGEVDQGKRGNLRGRRRTPRSAVGKNVAVSMARFVVILLLWAPGSAKVLLCSAVRRTYCC